MAKSNHLMALLSVWGIVLVVLGHSGFEEPIIQEKLSGLHSWIYSFHMPLFFFISGFLFSLTNPELRDACTRRFILKKTKRLIVPYLVLGTIIFGIKFLFAGLSHAVREFSVTNFLKMFVIPTAPFSTIGHLWYVFTLYVIFLMTLGLIIVRLLSSNKLKLLLVIVGSWFLYYVLPEMKLFNLSGALYYAPYFILGILLQGNYSSFDVLFHGAGVHFKCLIYFALSLLLTLLPLSGFLVKITRAIIGILMSLSLCSIILQNMPKLEDWMVNFSNRTYTIYLLSWFGQYFVKFILVNLLDLHYLIVVVGMFLGGLLFPVLVCWLVDRVPLFNNKGIRLIIGY